ncbi:MAG TPA: hypothetical protein VF657_08325, partial [Actinoplanes sp.]
PVAGTPFQAMVVTSWSGVDVTGTPVTASYSNGGSAATTTALTSGPYTPGAGGLALAGYASHAVTTFTATAPDTALPVASSTGTVRTALVGYRLAPGGSALTHAATIDTARAYSSAAIYVAPVAEVAPPVVVGLTRPLYGSSFEAASDALALSGVQSLWNGVVGKPCEVFRVFSSTFVQNPTSFLAPIIAAGITPWWSTKWSTNPAVDYPLLKANLDALGAKVIVTAQHEPENDGGTMTHSVFQAGSAAFFDGLVGDPDVIIGEVLMRESFANGSAALWLANNGKRHFIGADGYNPKGPNGLTYPALLTPVREFAAGYGDLPVYWGEISSQGNDDERSAYFASAFLHNETHASVRVWCHYHSTGGERAGNPPSWHLDQARAGAGLNQVGSWTLTAKPSAPSGPLVYAVGALAADAMTPAVYNAAMARATARPLTGSVVAPVEDEDEPEPVIPPVPAVVFYEPRHETPQWQWVLATAAGENIADLIGARSKRVTWRLDSGAEASWSMDGRHPSTLDAEELLTDLKVYRDGVLMFRGRVGGSEDSLDGNSHTVSMSAADYRTLLHRRFLQAETTYTGIDQEQIGWNLISYTEGLTGIDLGITRNLNDHGVNRTRVYPAGQNIGEALENLGRLIDGFNWEITPELVYRTWYPTRGTYRDFPAEYGNTVSSLRRSVDPTSFANVIRASGADTLTPIIAVSDNLAVRPEGRFEIQYGDPDIKEQATLQARAEAELQRAEIILPSYSCTLLPHRWSPADAWLGDTTQIVVQSGRLDVATSERIEEISVSVADDGAETVELTYGRRRRDTQTRWLRQYGARLTNLERR